jgi:hypothetical protein
MKTQSDPPTASDREPAEKKKWVEPVTALLMALATLSTAWCSFQSAAWTRTSNRLMNEFNALERRAGLLSIQGRQQATIHTTMFMQMLAAQQAGNERLATSTSSVFRPMHVRLTTHGWPKSPLKIQTPIHILLCRDCTKCGGRARPPRLAPTLQTACRKLAAPETYPVNTSRTPFCLPQYFSSPAHQENLSSAGCV